MSKVCQLSGKRRSIGHKVSHSNRKTKRTFAPNLIKKTIIDPVTGTKLAVRMSTRAQRTMVKNPGKFQAAITSLVKRKQRRLVAAK